jgi:RNA 3'-terminal phosphate cyclase (ATP)
VIEIDGSMGEGGGQVLRSALTLSLLTGKGFRISRVRASRPQPGLFPQHLAAVRAAAQVASASAYGDRLGSCDLRFTPGTARPGHYHFDIGTAGATGLVLQTLLLPLALADGASTLAISGGTHVPWSPCFHYLDWQWRPLLERIGISFQLSLTTAGFFPEGGGQLRAQIPGAARPRRLELCERGCLQRLRGVSAVANLPIEIAKRQRRQAMRRLADGVPQAQVDIELEVLPARSRGTLLLLLAEFERSRACFFALGARGKRAERVADEAVEDLLEFLASDAALDRWTADQLLLPLAVTGDASWFSTAEVSRHLSTNAAVIEAFLPVHVGIEPQPGGSARVRVGPSSG